MRTGSARSVDQGLQLLCVSGERAPSEVPVLDEPSCHGRAVQDQEGDDDAPRVPARLSRDGQRLALIERDAPLDRAQVVELGLGLFDQEHSVRLPEGEEVDPAAGLTAADRDLGSRDPAGPLEPACDVAGQPGMDRVVLTPAIAEVAGIELERRADTERGQHALDGGEIEVGLPLRARCARPSCGRSAIDSPARAGTSR